MSERKIRETADLNGIVLLDKKENETSFDCANRTKKLLGVKKVGHAGTLDPFATGLLILLVGKCTRLQQEFMLMEKRYQATFQFGTTTDTLDPTGKIIATAPCTLELDKIETTIQKHFLGEIEQRPPIFSAVKVNGKRAYALSRQGISVDLPMKKVTIREYKVLSCDPEKKEIKVDLLTSSGTYVRTLAKDLGEKLNSVAHVSQLRRIAIGDLSIANAISLIDRNIEKPSENKNILLKALQSPCSYLKGKEWTIDAITEKKIIKAKKNKDFSDFFPFFDQERYCKIISKDKKNLIAVLTKANEHKINCLYLDTHTFNTF